MASEGLALLMARKHPARALRRIPNGEEIQTAARMVAALEGDRAAKAQAIRFAIDGAFARSKDGPPSARFIFGRIEHFLSHIEHGERKAANDARQAQSQAREAHRRPVTPKPTALSEPEREAVDRDIARAFDALDAARDYQLAAGTLRPAALNETKLSVTPRDDASTRAEIEAELAALAARNPALAATLCRAGHATEKLPSVHRAPRLDIQVSVAANEGGGG